MAQCSASNGWVSRGRNTSTPGPPPAVCGQPECEPGTDDSSWQGVNLPHDFVVRASTLAAMANMSWKTWSRGDGACMGRLATRYCVCFAFGEAPSGIVFVLAEK
jgi:hypothetical protein